MNEDQRLVVVSNRLPVALERKGGDWRLHFSPGGLVAALSPVLQQRQGLWIGWPGTTDPVDAKDYLPARAKKLGYDLEAVALNPEDLEKFYYGFSNEIIWPLFHDLQNFCNFKPEYWTTYEDVNRRFAKAVADNLRPGDLLWVHDYHLFNVGRELRRMGTSSFIGFFLHIPFPPLDIFLKLPWRFSILRALLQYDLLGFQTPRDVRNFIHVVRAAMPEVQVTSDGPVLTLRARDREVRVGSFPISIDHKATVEQAESEAVVKRAQVLRERLPNRQFIIGVDRLDYTKGIPNRLQAFRTALERYPDLHLNVTYIQVVSPSREDIPMYHALKTDIERAVGEINGEFTQAGWVPIHYIHRNLTRNEIIAYYRTSRIALVTPLKDGMNLVAKEYCGANVDDDGVLILSEFAGAAAQLQKGALLVNPYHVDQVADAIYEAFTMPREERQRRMRMMRSSIREHDVYWWVDAFLKVANAKDLSGLPAMEDYAPRASLDSEPRRAPPRPPPPARPGPDEA